MNSFLVKVGIVTIVILLVLIIKMIDDYLYFRKLSALGEDKTNMADERVSKAAGIFAEGGSTSEIREILLNCIDFDEDDVEEILQLTSTLTVDSDIRFKAFIQAVNKVSGFEILNLK